MRELTIGKLRGLRQCSGPRGTLSVLALDHRNNLRKALRPEAPGEVSDDALIAFKREAVTELAEAATAVLLDPEFGAPQCIASGALPGDRGLVVALERTGYGADAHARESRILAGWSVAKARRMGASAAKLLVYYHPEASTAGAIERLVRDVAEECAREDLALLLEPLVYSPEPVPLSPDARRRAILEAARRLAGPGSRRAQGGVSGVVHGRRGVARSLSGADRRDACAVDPPLGVGRLRDLPAPDGGRVPGRGLGYRGGARGLERGHAPRGRGTDRVPARAGAAEDGGGHRVLRAIRAPVDGGLRGPGGRRPVVLARLIRMAGGGRREA